MGSSRAKTKSTKKNSSTTTEAPLPLPVALGLGSNLDNPERQLGDAIARLAIVLDELRVAPLFRSRPVSPLAQPEYLNSAAIGLCRLAPEALLAALKRIEYAAGRRRGARHGPRVLDIDLLLYGDLVIDRPELSLPHPDLHRRRFVLEPLAELAAEWRVPPDGRTVGDLLADLDDGEPLERLEWSSPPLL